MNWLKVLNLDRRNWAGVDGFMSDVYAAAKRRERSAWRTIAHFGVAQLVIVTLEPMAAEAAERLAELEGRHGDLAAELGAKKAAIDLLYTELRDTDRPRSPENLQRGRDKMRLIAEGKAISGRLAELSAKLPDARTRSAGMARAVAELRAIPLPPPDALPGLREWLNQAEL